MTTDQIFNQLISMLSYNEGVNYHELLVDGDFQRAAPSIEGLVSKGFFQDDPNNLEHSFWVMVGGECLERDEFFGPEDSDYRNLDRALHDIWERC